MVITGANGLVHGRRVGVGRVRMRRDKCPSVFRWPSSSSEARAWAGPPSHLLPCNGPKGHGGMHGATIHDETGIYTVEWSDRDGLLATRERVN